MKKPTLLLLSLLLFLVACSLNRRLTDQTATSNRGMVATAHPLATQAGAEMLALGGNAADAAVAAAFVLSVTEPSMSGIGGRLQAILRLPNGEVRGIDATSQSPMRYDTSVVKPQRYGYTTIGIPGVVAGLTKILEEYGSLPLPAVMGPAIRHAEEGFKILPGEAARHAQARHQLGEFVGSRQYFLQRNGETYQAGDKLVQKDLAQTLRRIAEGGRDAFYRGEIARRIVADMQAHGGLLTMDDLAGYQALDARIVTGNYRGHDLHGLWLPSYGAITIEILHILENLPMGSLDEEDWAEAVYQAQALAYQDRMKQYTSEAMSRLLTSKSYAKELAALINLDTNQHAFGFLEPAPESWAVAGHTTHLSTADQQGMMVALTQSLGPNMGSKVAAPDLGFLYAVSLGAYLGIYEPGQRVGSHISPLLITQDGKPFLSLGAAGGSRIPTAVAQVTCRVIDQALPLEAALAAPRVHPDQDSLLLETHAAGAWPAEVIPTLLREGFKVKTIPEEGRFGRVHAVYYNPKKKKWTGGADPDWEGTAAAPRK